MRKTTSLIRVTMTLIVLGMIGCGKPDRDERLAEMAKHSVETQAKQNEQMADQSQQTAETARHLVEEDAKARREIADAHATLRSELQEERVGIDQQRTEMERERRDLSARRARDPIIAETIGAIGGIIACLLPLLLAGYVLYTTNRNKNDTEMLNELLVTGIINDELRLLSGPRESAARLNHRSDVDTADDSPSEHGEP
jgi:hypothetical protein